MDVTSYILGKKAGGSGGTTDYSLLTNKPSINGVELNGNKTSSQLGIGSPVYFIENNSQDNPFIFDEHDLGVYFVKGDNPLGFDQTKKIFYTKGTASQNVGTMAISRNGFFQIVKKYSEANNSEIIGFQMPQYDVSYGKLIASVGTFTKVDSGSGVGSSVINQNSSYGADMNSIFTALNGYNGGGTQVLKNVYGTLTWVDE